MIGTARRRRGTTLIEMLALITVLSILLGLCGGMIHLLMKLDRSGRVASDEAADLARLARDFRSDVHASTPAGPTTPAPDRLDLTLDGRTVEYQVRPGDVLRTLRDGDKIRRRETYRRPARASVRFALATDGTPPMASIVVDREGGGKDGSLYRDLRIDAVIGSDRRFSPRPE